MRIVVAAAGTGGHVYPALVIAEAMVDQGVDRSDIIVFGGDRKAETAAPDAGFSFAGFELTKLRRSLSFSNVKIPFVLRATAAAMTSELKRRSVDAVLGMSGYVTVPAAIASRRAGVPFLLHEQNASPGLAARFAARRARQTFLGLPGKAEGLARSSIVGNPLRPEFVDFRREVLRVEARARYELDPDAVVVGIVGGSLGAKVLNEAAAGIADQAPGGTAIVHLTGEARAGAGASQGASLPWRQLTYEDRMDLFFAASDLLVCRAGAMTVSEVAATRTPAVFVPLESVGQDHNAMALVSKGAARMVRQKDAGDLPATVGGLVADPAARRAMVESSGPIGRSDAAATVATAVIGAAS